MNRKNLQFFFSLLIIIAFFVWINAFSSAAPADANLHVYFLNVGQGDSAYIKTPDGRDILIDGGPDDSVLGELGRVMTFGDRRIDLVVLTHPHADHLTGLISVVNRFEIGAVWETGVEYSSATYDTWKNLIEEKGIEDIFVDANTKKQFGAINFLVLYPLSSAKNQAIDNVNNSSIISEIDYNKFSALFLGDAEISTQTQILGKIKPTTVVKIAHHGATNGLNEDLLKIARPSIAVISVGRNSFGHPAASTLSFLKSIATQIFRTDQNGTIDFSSDGVEWWVK